MTNAPRGDTAPSHVLSLRASALLVVAGLCGLVALFLVAPALPVPSSNGLYRAMAYVLMALVMGAAVVVMCGLSNLAQGPIRKPLIVGMCFLGGGVAATALEWEWLADLGRLIGASSLGLAASRAIREPHWLPAVCAAVTISDAWSVFAAHGISRRVIDNHAEVIPWFTVRIPLPGQPLSEAAQLGTTDLFFAGLFLGAAVRFGLGPVRTGIGLALAVPATFAVGIEVLGGQAVPALPLMALCTIAAHPRFYIRSVAAAIRPNRSPLTPEDDDWEDPWAGPLEPPTRQ